MRASTGKGILRRNSGFTLLEIMVVIVILGLLAAIVVPKLIGRTEEAKRTQTRIQIKNVEQALQLFKLDNGFYPSTEQGLSALVRNPEIGRVPKNYRKGGYLDRVPTDPWANAYVYVSPGAERDYEISSYGGDGVPGGEGEDGDIHSWDAQ
ncbi:MAG TPA: type II secretion system protein GspG [Deltaproteobacteria bacterium]|nr:MAG: type II secretion system protein GspG [Deltaproteobacteria bacterium GWC2_65_14]HBO69359.1 type II secretion system protein GspG [Deltaproteobacteria bacterium]